MPCVIWSQPCLNQETAHGLHIINQAIDDGSDPRQFGQQVVEHLRSVLLAQTASADLLDASADDRELFGQQATMIMKSQLLRAVRAFNDAVNNYTGGWQPQLALELALIESLQEPEVQVVQQVVQQPTYPSQQTLAQTAPESVASYERATTLRTGRTACYRSFCCEGKVVGSPAFDFFEYAQSHW